MADNMHRHHRQRVKQTFDENGGKGMHDVNLLEMMLFFAVPQGDTNPLAHRLLDRFGSFDRVLEASKTELMTVKGVGDHVATYLTMYLPVFKRYNQNKCENTFTYFDTDKLKEHISAEYVNVKKERAMLLHFDAHAKFINSSWIGEGDNDYVVINNKVVAASVIENNSSIVVLVHNHPSGVAVPSSQDILAAKNLRNFLQSINVSLVESAICTYGEVKFFSEMGKRIDVD